MTGKAKIEALTNSWYSFVVITGLVSLVQNGLGFFSLLFTAGSVAFSIVLTWFLGKRLLARSSLTRAILVLVSAASTIFGSLGFARMTWSFFGDMSFGALVTIVLTLGSVVMNVRSFRCLTDDAVKSYIRG
jgi:hypothetical protein